MAIICPTVTASEPHEYREQIETAMSFSKRLHIDLADGVFTPNKLMDGLDNVWLPKEVICDVHLMYEAVLPFLNKLIELRPNMVIVHAEAVGKFYEVARPLHQAGIKVGVALLEHSAVDRIKPAIKDIDHVLIFSGDLGHFGGKAKLSLLDKARQLRKLKPELEIGWDGGINFDNAKVLVAGGIDVLNVGGAIQRSADPNAAYAKLKVLIGD